MKTITVNIKVENGNVFYLLDGKEIARSFMAHESEILNPRKLPEYQVRFLPESKKIYGRFAGRHPNEAVLPYLNHMIYRHFGNMGFRVVISMP